MLDLPTRDLLIVTILDRSKVSNRLVCSIDALHADNCFIAVFCGDMIIGIACLFFAYEVIERKAILSEVYEC